MKSSKVYVGGVLALSQGESAVAVYPAGKGEKYSYLLLATGRVTTMKGARINGVGVARFVAERGFSLAQPGNVQAERLADHVDVVDGLALVEDASVDYAAELTKEFAGQHCTYVPFEPEKPFEAIKVRPASGFITRVLTFSTGFSATQVQGEGLSGADLSSGWLVGQNGDPEQMPRSTEYGGIVERAMFVIANSGLASLFGPANLGVDDDAPYSAIYPRGEMTLALPNGDRIIAGIDAGDELCVQYIRGNAIVYSRRGLSGGSRGPSLGDAVGSIAAVIVRVQEMDAAVPAKARRVKKA